MHLKIDIYPRFNYPKLLLYITFARQKVGKVLAKPILYIKTNTLTKTTGLFSLVISY